MKRRTKKREPALTREDLVGLVRSLQSGTLGEEELERGIATFDRAVKHPAGNGLVFWPTHWGLPDDPSAEQIVDAAFSWVPRVIALRATLSRALKGSARRFVLLEGGEFKCVSVVTDVTHVVGDVLAVALSGTHLKDGRMASHGFVDGACSMGLLLERVNVPPGTDLTTVYSAKT